MLEERSTLSKTPFFLLLNILVKLNILGKTRFTPANLLISKNTLFLGNSKIFTSQKPGHVGYVLHGAVVLELSTGKQRLALVANPRAPVKEDVFEQSLHRVVTKEANLVVLGAWLVVVPCCATTCLNDEYKICSECF